MPVASKRALRRLVGGIVAAAFAACAAPGQAARTGEPIMVHIQWPGSICAGTRPSFEATLLPNNTVVTEDLRARPNDPSRKRSGSFSVSRFERARFERLLEPLRAKMRRSRVMTRTFARLAFASALAAGYAVSRPERRNQTFRPRCPKLRYHHRARPVFSLQSASTGGRPGTCFSNG